MIGKFVEFEKSRWNSSFQTNVRYEYKGTIKDKVRAVIGKDVVDCYVIINESNEVLLVPPYDVKRVVFED